ncbi:MAG: SRPBCC domain-containing protein [Acidobacteria bacterium]|nr:SRPBCC domain-containing protein [Acidobacteriota bacterium]
MKRNLRVEVVYPYPPQTVWRALTDPRAISEWLMKNDFEPRVGHRFQFHTDPAPGFTGIVDCEVLVVDEPHRLVYTWKSSAIDTRVAFTLEAVPAGTRLVLEHTGFSGLKAVLVSFILGSGWNSKILREALPAAIAKHESAASAPRPE